jgi:hypothetical protein
MFQSWVSSTLGSIGRYQAGANINWTNAQRMSVGGAFPGEVVALWGNLYQLVLNRSGGALAVGDTVSLSIADSTRIGNLTAASTPAVLTTDDTQDTNLAGSDSWPGYVGVTAGAFATTAAETRRQIQANAPAAGASTLTIAGGPTYTGYADGPVNGDPRLDADAIGTIAAPPDNTYDYEVFCPWEVVKTDLDALLTSVPQGVVVSTSITDDQFGLIQIAGICMANVDGTTDLVAGDLLIPDAAAGVLSKWVVTTTDPTTAQVNQGNYLFGRILGAYTANSVGLRMIQMMNRPLFPHAINP